MLIRVGTDYYAVQLVEGYISRGEDQFVGVCDHLRRQILISDQLSESDRLRVLVDRWINAWSHHESLDQDEPWPGVASDLADVFAEVFIDSMNLLDGCLRESATDAMLQVLGLHGRYGPQLKLRLVD